jgi:hypothetical protein
MRNHIVTQAYKVAQANPVTMTTEEKIRYGMLALTGATIIFAALGLHHVTPLGGVIGGIGTS